MTYSPYSMRVGGGGGGGVAISNAKLKKQNAKLQMFDNKLLIDSIYSLQVFIIIVYPVKFTQHISFMCCGVPRITVVYFILLIVSVISLPLALLVTNSPLRKWSILTVKRWSSSIKSLS